MESIEIYSELQKKVFKHYGIEALSFELVKKGVLTTNYIVTTPDTKYFLKRYRFDLEKRVTENHLIEHFFADKGIPVILGIPAHNGRTYFTHGNGFYTLFPFVNGIQYERGMLPEHAIRSFGKMLADIHTCGKNVTIQIEERMSAWNTTKSMEFFKSMLAFISSKKELTEFDHVARESCEYKKSLLMQYTVDQNSLGFKYDHIIHGDYVDQNVFWDSNNEILAVFDFEKAQMAPRMFEVFRAMFLSFYSGHDPEKDLQTVTLFLKEYHSHYPISRDECVRGFELFYGKCIHTLWIEQQHYIHNQTRSDHFLRIDLDRLKSLTLHKQLILETLLKVVV